MKKILTDFFRDKIAPHSQVISDAKNRISEIDATFMESFDHTKALQEAQEDIASFEAKIQHLYRELEAFQTGPVSSTTVTSTPVKTKSKAPASDDIALLSDIEIIEKDLQQTTRDLDFTRKRKESYEFQAALPEERSELERLIAEKTTILEEAAKSLNNLIFEGEKKSFVFSWVAKLNLFESNTDSANIFHYLAHYNILHLVLPSMLENASLIVKRELGKTFNATDAKRAVLEKLGNTDSSGLPPLQRALIRDSEESFKYIMELPDCKKGFFEVGHGGSNIFHQAILKGHFQYLLPFIEDRLEQLAQDEGFVPPAGSVSDHVKLMLASENIKGYSPAKLAAYVASSEDFQYIFNSGILKLSSSRKEKQVETCSEDRVISTKQAAVADLLELEEGPITIPMDFVSTTGSTSDSPAGSSDAVAVDDVASVISKRLVEVDLLKQDVLIDFLFEGNRNVEKFILAMVNDGCEDIFDLILTRQRITGNFELAKYIIQITEQVRDIKSLERDHIKFPEIISIYRKIFKEYWPQITLNDNNVKAYTQLEELAQQMDSQGGKVFGIPSDKLKEALDIPEAVLSQYDGDIFQASQAIFFDRVSDGYELDLATKTLAKSTVGMNTPSPVRINIREIVNSTVKKKALAEHQDILRHIESTVDSVEAVVVPSIRSQLKETTGLNDSLDVDKPSDDDDDCDEVKIEISEHLQLIFDEIKSLKDTPGNEHFLEIYDKANPSVTENDVDTTILLLATGMRNDPEAFLNFVNNATVEVDGEVVTLEGFLAEYIEHASIDMFDNYGSINFEPAMAEIIAVALAKAGKLECKHLSFVMKVHNEGALDAAIRIGLESQLLTWEDILFLAFEKDNLIAVPESGTSVLNKFLSESIETSALESIFANLIPALVSRLTQISMIICDDVASEARVLKTLEARVEFVASLLNSEKVADEQKIAFEDGALENFTQIFGTFADPGRTLDYNYTKKTLVVIAEGLKPHLNNQKFIGTDFSALLVQYEKPAEHQADSSTVADISDAVVVMPMSSEPDAVPVSGDADAVDIDGTTEY